MNRSYSESESAFSPRGRFGRLSYLGWNMLMIFAVLILTVMLAALSPGLFTDSSALVSSSLVAAVILGIAYLVMFYLSFVFTIRRLHDRNHTGWLSILIFVPIINLFFMLYLIFAKGDDCINLYGPQRSTRGWEKVLGGIYFLIFPMAILAAIVLPAYQDYVTHIQHKHIHTSIQPAD
ncbi:MAG: DUF805 domain-containing protein [Acinetobacter sp.]